MRATHLSTWKRTVRSAVSRHLRASNCERRTRRHAAPAAIAGVERLEDRALLSAGSLDASFGNGGIVSTDIGEPGTSDEGVDVVAWQSDGKMIVIGSSNRSFTDDVAAVRYNVDGSLDASFGDGGRVTIDFGNSFDVARSVAVDAQGRILIAGETSVFGGTEGIVARLTADGSLDTTFGTGGKTLVDFGSNFDTIYSVAVDAQGHIVVGGDTAATVFDRDMAVARLTDAGAFDTSFGTNGVVSIDFGVDDDYGRSVAVDAEGRVLIAGHSWQGFATHLDYAVARLTTAGDLDGTFDIDGKTTIDVTTRDDVGLDLALDSQGHIVLGGHSRQTTGRLDLSAVRLNADGTLDTSFDGDGKRTFDVRGTNDYGNGVAVDALDRIILAGHADATAGGSRDLAVARFLSDGSLDGSFGVSGTAVIDFGGTNDYATGSEPTAFGSGVTIDAQGRIVVAGTSQQAFFGSWYDVAVARLTDAGTLDASFDDDGKVLTDLMRLSRDAGYDVSAVQPDGKLIVVGTSSSSTTGGGLVVLRYNADGTRDTSFGDGGTAIVGITGAFEDQRRVVVDSQGRILILSQTSTPATSFDFAVARLNADGSLDMTFGDGGKTVVDLGGWDTPRGIAVDSQDRVILIGDANNEFAVVRLDEIGQLDATFGGDGVVAVDFGFGSSDGYDVVLDANDRIVLVGNNFTDVAVARLLEDGSLDATFAGDGTTLVNIGGGFLGGRSVEIDSQGRIVIGGAVGTLFGPFAVVRLHADGSVDTSFGGDGLASVDFGVFGDLYDLALDSRDRVIVVGSDYSSGDRDPAVARFTVDGDLDPLFDGDGKLLLEFGSFRNAARGVEVDAQDRIVLVGTADDDILLARLLGNTDPAADAGGPYVVEEGETVALAGLGDDPDPDSTLTFAWDLDGDGQFGETGAGAAYGDETGANPVFFAAGALDGPESITVALRVTDDLGAASVDTATIEIVNAEPLAFVDGPASGVRFQPRTFVFSADDPSDADDAAGFSFVIDWGDGTGETIAAVAGQTSIALDHEFTALGTYTVSVTATDKDGGAGTATHFVSIVVAELQDDPLYPGQQVLVVGGTDGDDAISFLPGSGGSEIVVSLNGTDSAYSTGGLGRLLAFGGDGDDDLQVSGSIGFAAWLDGGAGNDRLKGGAGHDVLLGGDGDDLIVGGAGRDLLIGGAGADRIVGNSDDDVLIAGSIDGGATVHAAIMTEWTSTATVNDRIAEVAALLAGLLVDDGAADVLTGSSGDDYFLFNSDDDRATDLQDDAFASDLDWILAEI